MNLRQITLLSAFCLVAVSCKNGEKNQAAAKGAVNSKLQSWKPTRQAAIYFTTGSLGYMEPCGCTSKPMGGIQRLATIVKSEKLESALIDAGNLLLPKDHIDKSNRDQHVYKAETLADFYQKLGVKAVNLGYTDLREGQAFLKTLQEKSKTPFLSTNDRFQSKAGPSVERAVIHVLDGIRVGVTGISLDSKNSRARISEDEKKSLQKEIRALVTQKAEVLVLLADASASGAEELARTFPELNFVIRSPGSKITREPSAPKKVGDVAVLEAGSQGQYVGRLELSLDANAPSKLSFDDGGLSMKGKAKLLERKMNALQRDIERLSKDPKGAAAVSARKKQLSVLKKRLSRLSSGQVQNGPHAKFRLIALTEDVPSDKEGDAVLKAYYAQLVKMNLTKGDVTLCEKKNAKDAVYVGTKVCADCHDEAYAFWKKSKHAKAWKTLEDDNKHFDLTCIACHTVGYQEPGGFCRLADVGVLKDVGCENCHGPGSIHAEDEDPDSIVLASTENTCAKLCHVPEHSDRFEYTTYLKEITGEGHELTEASLPKN